MLESRLRGEFCLGEFIVNLTQRVVVRVHLSNLASGRNSTRQEVDVKQTAVRDDNND